MEQEIVLSGYCKYIDSSRTVIVEDSEPDCLFDTCPHAPNCPIAQNIRQLSEK